MKLKVASQPVQLVKTLRLALLAIAKARLFRRRLMGLLQRQLLSLRAVAKILWKYLCAGWGEQKRRPSSSCTASVQAKGYLGHQDGEEVLTGPSVEVDSTYTLVRDGKRVPLSGVMPSNVYPLAGSSIHNASRTSVNLRTNLEAHGRLTGRSRPNSDAGSNRGTDYAGSIRSGSGGGSHYSASVVNIDVPVEYHSSDGHLTIPAQVARPSSPLRNPTPILKEPIPSGGELRPSKTGNMVPSTLDPEVPVYLRDTDSPQQMWPYDGIVAVVPEATQRYSRRSIIENVNHEIEIPAFTTSFNHPAAPKGWIRHAHPEGARYFSHSTKNVLTDADLFDPVILERITHDIHLIEMEVADRLFHTPKDSHLVLSVYYDDDKEKLSTTTYYYFVDHSARTLFYLDPFDAENLGSAWIEAPGCNSMNHLYYEFEAQYWYFVNLYPSSRHLTQDVIAELRDMAHHCIGDSMTSSSSIAPFPLEILQKILDYTVSMERNLDTSASVGTMSLLARLRFVFSHTRYLHFHGEGHARLERHISVYGFSTNQRTWFIKTLSLFLFSAPDVQLKNLQRMWVDGIIHKSVWEELIKKMNDEWQEFVLFGTVLLPANVGLLSIQSVDNEETMYRSPIQIASYLSIVSSIGSILLGLLLLRQNRTKIKQTADDIQGYLTRRNHPLLGLETLAILFSLPYALLMWAMVAFLAAFCLLCFLHTRTATRAIIGSMSAVVAAMIAWCVYNSWEKHDSNNGTVQDNRLSLFTPFKKAKETLDELLEKVRMSHSETEIRPPSITIQLRQPTSATSATSRLGGVALDDSGANV